MASTQDAVDAAGVTWDPVTVHLPDLTHNFSHAGIDRVVCGPRREVTLTLTTFVLDPARVGTFKPVKGITVRFGGIENFEDVSSFFARAYHTTSELADMRYSTTHASKPGRLFFDIVFERIDAEITIRCTSLTVEGPHDPSFSTK